ncbi:glycosyl hydrolase [Guptibacillus hwajinpoensis]|uniref:glycosyl hydrolase n=1 Tax=Guptibacillus hwajinpoensis TaxID=208199 RepID=UPI0024B3B8B0|nr:glycosyl hydrolase [Pseudalkalibacillus hwajinpoensis]
MEDYIELKEQFTSTSPPSSLFPLLWLHGDPREDASSIRQEIAAMDEGGCGGFIIESRPHRDYLGDGWWRDLDICIDEAKKRGMKVWIFDEEYYPSGIAGGKVLQSMPEARMKVLVKESIYWNPLEEEFDIKNLNTFDKIFKCVCVPYDKHSDLQWELCKRFNDLDNLLLWQSSVVNETTSWMIHVIGIKPSWSGRMYEKMVDYLDPNVTDCFINLTYEKTKERYGHIFGDIIQGFFGDETSFENFASYDVLFGEDTPCMPWTRSMREAFYKNKGYDLFDEIEWLWYEHTDGRAARVRFDFMDTITQLFSQNFFARIQSWCHTEGVSFIGHVVEDNQAHMHHGYGVGHYFRATRHFDMGGYDFVLRQVDSEQKLEPYEENYPQFSHYREASNPDFFHYTLGKLAQSQAHLEIGTDLVMCENFGAYGWDLGLREMKWLTDWMTVRGTNWYVPHAFSPIFPDEDCPPHFYAGGNNPQWKFFRKWADYANRSCLMLKRSEHVSKIAVLYPAESHWAGDETLLDKVTKELMKDQYDFDILSMDLLMNHDRCRLVEGKLCIAQHQFSCVILPGIETLPVEVLERLLEFRDSGGLLLQVECGVKKDSGGNHPLINSSLLSLTEKEEPVGLCNLPDILDHYPYLRSLQLKNEFPELRFCHYQRSEFDIFFINNESLQSVFEDTVMFSASGTPEIWDAMSGTVIQLPVYHHVGEKTFISMRLAPYEGVFIVFRPNGLDDLNVPIGSIKYNDFITRDGQDNLVHVSEMYALPLTDWKSTHINSPISSLVDSNPLPDPGNWITQEGFESFSGTISYECKFIMDTEMLEKIYDGHASIDLGEVYETAKMRINDHKLSIKICPPYVWKVPRNLLQEGINTLIVEVTNTLGAAVNSDFNRINPAPAGLMGPAKLVIYWTQ